MVAREIVLWPTRPSRAIGPAPKPVIDRFLDKVMPEPNTGCWLWTGAVNKSGYGVLGIGSKYDNTRRNVLAHRLAIELFGGAVPEHLDVDHLCRVPCCVNPEHMEVVTHRENISRGKNSDLREYGKWTKR